MRYAAKDAEAKTFTIYVSDLEVNGSKVALPTPWKHENVVSPEAKAAIEKYMKTTYRPAEHGLKSAAGVVASNLADAQARIDFKFEPPGAVAASTPADMRPSHALLFVKMPLRMAWEGFALPGAAEYDADVVVKDGRHVLVLTTFRLGKKVATSEYAFDDEGLLVSARQDGESELRFAWGGAGDRRRIERVTMESPTPKGTGLYTCSLVYADVGGLQAPVSYSVEGTTAGVRQYLISARVENLVVDGKKVDVVDPSAHVNVVTPEAKAALEAFAKLAYRTNEHGFRSASGTLAPGGIRFDVTPQGAVVRPPEIDPGGTWASVGRGVQPMLGFAYNGVAIVDSPQHDAEFVEQQGRRVLVVTTYRAGSPVAKSESVFDERGLLVSMRSTSLGESSSKTEMRLAWTDVAGQWQLERMECWDASKPVHVTVALAFADVSGLHVPVSLKWMMSNVPGVKRPLLLAVEGFVLNGAPVASPKVALHDNQVTPEAESLMSAYARLVYRPVEHGLIAASGDVVPEGPKPLRRRFSFFAPLFLSVTLPPEGKPDSPDGRAMAASTRLALLGAIDALRVSESLEYDARVVERDGARILEVVEYRAGARTATSEAAFDAAGLVATLRRREGADPAAPTSDVTYRLEWEKAGDVSRVRGIDLSVGAAEARAHKRYAYSYATIDGIQFVTAYTVAFSESGSAEKLYRYLIEDLVLNGKKVAPAKPSDGRAPDDGKK
jgi:hypothetical protein